VWKSILAALVICVSTLPTLAGLSAKDMELAHGLAKILTIADRCGYLIDQAALKHYYQSSGLDTPEALGAISLLSMNYEDGPPPTASDCTLAKTTGEKLGIVSPKG